MKVKRSEVRTILSEALKEIILEANGNDNMQQPQQQAQQQPQPQAQQQAQPQQQQQGQQPQQQGQQSSVQDMERALIGKLVENGNAFPNPPAGSTKRDLMPQFDKSAHGQDGAVAQMVNHLGGAGAQNESKQINKNMKINEAKLHNIVAESVKKVLTELDWKTYANAAKKANAELSNPQDLKNPESVKKYMRRARQYKDFSKQRDKEFNEKYSQDGIDDGVKYHFGMSGGVPELTRDFGVKGKEEVHSLHVPNTDSRPDKFINSFPGERDKETYIDGRYDDAFGYPYPVGKGKPGYFGKQVGSKVYTPMDAGAEEYYKYKKGGYKYFDDPNIGWSPCVSESIDKAVKSVLKEYHPDKVMRDTQIELFRKKQMEQDEKEISNCMSELKPIFDNIQDKYGDLAYTAIMRLAKETNPNPKA